MQKLAKIQARSFAVQHGTEGLETIEKALLIIAGVVAGAALIAFAVTNVNKSMNGASTKLSAADKLAADASFSNPAV